MNYGKNLETAAENIRVLNAHGNEFVDTLIVERHIHDNELSYCAKINGAWAHGVTEKEAIENLAVLLEHYSDSLYKYVAENYRPAIAHIAHLQRIKVPKTCYHCRHYTAYRWCNVAECDEDPDSTCGDWEPTENCEGVD